MRKVMYLCDGEVPECEKTSCYKNGGPCRHTTDVDHAMNFMPGRGKNDTIWEGGPTSLQERGSADEDEAPVPMDLLP